VIESQRRGKEKDHLKKTSLGPLRQGQQLDTIKRKASSNKEQKTTKQKLEKHNELPLHTCKLSIDN
jgi:hypothetical protein